MSKKPSKYMQNLIKQGFKEARARIAFKNIQNAKANGIKNPYRHFIQGIEKYKDIQKITEVKKDKEDERN